MLTFIISRTGAAPAEKGILSLQVGKPILEKGFLHNFLQI